MDLVTRLRMEVSMQQRKVRAGDALAINTVRLLNDTIIEITDMQRTIKLATTCHEKVIA